MTSYVDLSAFEPLKAINTRNGEKSKRAGRNGAPMGPKQGRSQKKIYVGGANHNRPTITVFYTKVFGPTSDWASSKKGSVLP